MVKKGNKEQSMDEGNRIVAQEGRDDLPRARSPEEQIPAHRPPPNLALLLTALLVYSCLNLFLTSVDGLVTFLPLSTKHVRDDDVVRGWKGAALAAFGDIAVDFFGADTPFPDSRDGVKLGESTLNRFLLSNETVLVSKARLLFV